jgi:hypothetical protein
VQSASSPLTGPRTTGTHKPFASKNCVEMNYMVAEISCMPRLGEHLRFYRVRWRELKNWMKWLSAIQIFIATILRGANLSLEVLGWGLLGASAVTGSIAKTLDSMETHYYWSDTGRYAGTKKDCEGCANLMFAITIASFFAGIGCIIASILCWFLAYMFLGLSFLFCFKTDVEYFEHMANLIADKQQEIEALAASRPQNGDPSYLQAFDADKAGRMAKLSSELQDLITQREKESEIRARRNGLTSNKIVPADVETPTAIGAVPLAEVMVAQPGVPQSQPMPTQLGAPQPFSPQAVQPTPPQSLTPQALAPQPFAAQPYTVQPAPQTFVPQPYVSQHLVPQQQYAGQPYYAPQSASPQYNAQQSFAPQPYTSQHFIPQQQFVGQPNYAAQPFSAQPSAPQVFQAPVTGVVYVQPQANAGGAQEAVKTIYP